MTWSRAGAPLLVAILVCAAGSARAADSARPRLLLLPIVVHSAEDPQYLRDGLSDMLAARFDRIGAIELVRAPADQAGTSRLDEALEMAREARAQFVLFGSFTRFGRGASLDVQCAPVGASGEREPLREIFVHSGSIGEIIPDLDELAGKVSRFARGEQVAPPAAATLGGSTVAPSASPQLAELEERVAALEAAFAEALESLERSAREAPGASDLR